MKDILVVAPLQDVYDKSVRIVQEYGYDDVDVVLATMQEGLEMARKGQAQGASVVVSRGWTYNMIENELDIPAVEIPVSAYDIVESLAPIMSQIGQEESIGVVGHSHVIYGFDILKTLLPMKIVKIELQRKDDIATAIARYREAGITTFIGDSNVKTVSEELGHLGIQITSQKSSIHRSIQEARKLYASIRSRQQRAQQILTVTDFVHEGIIAIDEGGRISIFNHAAESIFGVRKEAVLGRMLHDAIPQCELLLTLENVTPSVGQVLTIEGNNLVVNRAPVLIGEEVVGAVATIQNVTEVQSVEQKIRRELSDRGFTAKHTFDDIIHDSGAMAECIDTGKQYALYDTPLLVTGESGVGKELFCQSLHNASPRRNGPFVAINCAAIPPSLIEAELFGHESGSFTGARRKGRAGIFELAHQGTVFLDEIGEIPLELQGRLLRVLQEHQIMRIGGDKIIPVDVRIICATNRPLELMVEEEKFRRDLLFRINVLTLHLPSLRELGPRAIIRLAEHFLARYAAKYARPVPRLAPETCAQLSSRPYKGNVRELKGLMERSVILGSVAKALEGETSPLAAAATASAAPAACSPLPAPDAPLDALPSMRTMMHTYMRGVLDRTGGNVQEACTILGISRSTLWRHLKP
ncbi:sigma 54-interacting transcriptional regulator [Desulfobaculum sp.]